MLKRILETLLSPLWPGPHTMSWTRDFEWFSLWLQRPLLELVAVAVCEEGAGLTPRMSVHLHPSEMSSSLPLPTDSSMASCMYYCLMNAAQFEFVVQIPLVTE